MRRMYKLDEWKRAHSEPKAEYFRSTWQQSNVRSLNSSFNWSVLFPCGFEVCPEELTRCCRWSPECPAPVSAASFGPCNDKPVLIFLRNLAIEKKKEEKNLLGCVQSAGRFTNEMKPNPSTKAWTADRVKGIVRGEKKSNLHNFPLNQNVID